MDEVLVVDLFLNNVLWQKNLFRFIQSVEVFLQQWCNSDITKIDFISLKFFHIELSPLIYGPHYVSGPEIILTLQYSCSIFKT